MVSLRSLTQITAFKVLQNHAAAQVVVGSRTYTDTNTDIVGGAIKCPGVLSVPSGDSQDNGICCVGGNVSTCDGWPLCAATASRTPVSCATKIPVSATDYSSLVESASSKYLDAEGNAKPSSTADGTTAKSTSEGTTGSSGEAKETEDSGSAAVGLTAPWAAGMVGGVLAFCLAL